MERQRQEEPSSDVIIWAPGNFMTKTQTFQLQEKISYFSLSLVELGFCSERVLTNSSGFLVKQIRSNNRTGVLLGDM